MMVGVPRRAVVIVPEAETAEVEAFRARWDPLGGSLAAHLTLVFPFDSAATIKEMEQALAPVLRRAPPFAVELSEPTLEGGEYVFLLAGRGDRELRELNRDLYAGVLDGPTLTKPFRPHLTIARCSPPEVAEQALRAAAGLWLRGTARTVRVYRIGDDGPHLELELALGTRRRH